MRPRLPGALLWLSAVIFGAGVAAAQSASPPAPAQYRIAFPNAVHHEAEISVRYTGLPTGPVTFRMSRSSPGRYALHEFAKNVYGVSASGEDGADLPIVRSGPYAWTVPDHSGGITFHYTLFADHADGTYAQVDHRHAHLNMPATFIWAEGEADRPVELTVELPVPDWKVATQLSRRGGTTFTAPNLAYFFDSPLEISSFALREWSVGDPDRQQTIRIALHHQGNDEDFDRYAEETRRIVAAQADIWGEYPQFDYGTYTFLADYLPHVDGDGMEHRNSTVITRPASLYEADFAQIGTTAHEFFHAWNVERLRPKDLEPFDFTRANPTDLLWFAEGFTSYYGPLSIRRADVWDTETYLDKLAGTLAYVLNSPGRRFGGPAAMSLRAPFVDAATAVDPTPFSETFTSYYPYGAVVALALDLEMRTRFAIPLDALMQQLWRTHGRPEIPYEQEDLEAALAEVTGDASFARRFFAQMVEGNALPDFEPLLERAGIVLSPKAPDTAWAGPNDLVTDGPVVTIDGNTRPGTPLYEAGLDRGDEILALGRRHVDSEDDWTGELARWAPGDIVPIRFLRRGEVVTAELTLAADPALSLQTYEAAGRTPSPAQLEFRSDWLGSDDRD
ncbi:peptidase M61 [Pacificimonas flava]|uniref:Peptidase M61 n=2 Tax=Pacificimonas TaxID=1960290 RepID=A0A219B3K8_9SPHN|nr:MULTISPECIES: PDZ domain-containing protein [Pacificimonas]MBZ6377449.1 M61 family metallopeptidase [Pacificimonas aurantium]OWV32851.1 peptidase M61 [Pacificimonas flava]